MERAFDDRDSGPAPAPVPVMKPMKRACLPHLGSTRTPSTMTLKVLTGDMKKGCVAGVS